MNNILTRPINKAYNTYTFNTKKYVMLNIWVGGRGILIHISHPLISHRPPYIITWILSFKFRPLYSLPSPPFSSTLSSPISPFSPTPSSPISLLRCPPPHISRCSNLVHDYVTLLLIGCLKTFKIMTSRNICSILLWSRIHSEDIV